MEINDYLQLILYFAVLLIVSPLLGLYMAMIYTEKKWKLSSIFDPIENLFCKLSGINKNRSMNWKEYSIALIVFHLICFVVVFFMQIFQAYFPLNPEHIANVPVFLAFNTAVSFVTNTNWQAYSGENTLSYGVQMIGLCVQNFTSAGVGMAVAVAFTRGLSKKSGGEIGNFWMDLFRSITFILIPLSILVSILLMNEGVVQSFSGYIKASTLEGNAQIIPLGPAASQIAIKQLGTNGGGFFGVNSAHPFENPSPFSNFIEMLSILLIPASLTFTYGKMTGNMRQGLSIFTAMLFMLCFGLVVSLYSEYMYNPIFEISGLMEGKETRFGITNSVLWGVATTSASNGSVNAMHDSFSPLTGLISILNIMLGEVIFGGVGAGLYGMLLFVILTVFISGLLVGRLQNTLEKKIESTEVKFAMFGVILPSVTILGLSAISVLIGPGLSSRNNVGPHGLTEILYAFSSGAGNNGSAFAGLNANTNYYNILIGISMLIGRFGVIIPVLAISGSMSVKKQIPFSSGTFSTDNWLFTVLLIFIIVIVGVLTFLPALFLGPIVEHFLMLKGMTF